jgi:putative membrane protein
MKNNQVYNFLLATIAVLAIIFIIACKKEPTADPEELAHEKNDAKFENTREKDAEFLVDEAAFNLEQAELGKLVSLKSNNADIKAFGKMMQTMHQRNISELDAFTVSKQVSIPTSLTDENKENYNTLNKKDIDNFDGAYLERVVDAHKNAIENCSSEMKKTVDADIKKWLTTELAFLREHLDNAMTLQSKLGNNQK